MATPSIKDLREMKILFFSPFARIIQHSIAEATILSELRRAGHETLAINCGKVFEGQCVTLDALGLQNANQSVISKTCRECVACGKSLFPDAIDLSELLAAKREEVKYKIKDAIIGLNQDNFMEFHFRGLPIGRLAAYQHMIHFKKFTEQITGGEWPKFIREVENCLIVLFALEEFSRRSSFNPDIVFTYNSLYSVNAVFCEFFASKGAKVYSLHASANLHHFLDTMLLMPKNSFEYLNRLKSTFKENCVKLKNSDIKYVFSHFKELAMGRSVFAYSKNIDHTSTPDIRSYFKIKSDSKLILAAMSSYDERFSGEYCGHLAKSTDAIFPTQIEWIRWLVDWASRRNDVHLVIRLHPREFPNKREGIQSHHSLLVLESLRDLPSNVSLNVPADNLSLYDIAREVDVALTAWSSVGKELMLLGIPLVLYTADSQWFPASLARCARNTSEYEQMIADALESGWSIANSMGVLKWLVFEMCHNTFELTTRLSPARKIRFINQVYRVFNKFFGPAFQVKRRIGRIVNPELFLSALETGKLRSQLLNLSTTDNPASDLAVTRRQLHTLGSIMFGSNSTKWPSKFSQILEPHCRN